MFNFSVLDLMRKGEKKTFQKKNIEPIFGKVNESDQIRTNIEINWGFLRKAVTSQCARWAGQKHMFFGNALPKSNVRARLKQKKT